MTEIALVVLVLVLVGMLVYAYFRCNRINEETESLVEQAHHEVRRDRG